MEQDGSGNPRWAPLAEQQTLKEVDLTEPVCGGSPWSTRSRMDERPGSGSIRGPQVPGLPGFIPAGLSL